MMDSFSSQKKLLNSHLHCETTSPQSFSDFSLALREDCRRGKECFTIVYFDFGDYDIPIEGISSVLLGT